MAVTCQQVLVLVDLQLNAAETFGSFRVDVLHVGHLAEASVHLRAGGEDQEQKARWHLVCGNLIPLLGHRAADHQPTCPWSLLQMRPPSLLTEPYVIGGHQRNLPSSGHTSHSNTHTVLLQRHTLLKDEFAGKGSRLPPQPQDLCCILPTSLWHFPV